MLAVDINSRAVHRSEHSCGTSVRLCTGLVFDAILSMYTLGINAAFHDPSACLLKDGVLLAAAEEERFTHIKHGKRPIPFSAYELPFHAIDYCLREGGITLCEIDHIAYSFDPALLLGRHRGDATITLPLEPSAQAVSADWQAPW